MVACFSQQCWAVLMNFCVKDGYFLDYFKTMAIFYPTMCLKNSIFFFRKNVVDIILFSVTETKYPVQSSGLIFLFYNGKSAYA